MKRRTTLSNNCLPIDVLLGHLRFAQRPFAVAVLLALISLPAIAQKEPCSEFQTFIKATYNFKPSVLTDGERTSKSAEMDRVWKMVKAKQGELLPCLRAEIKEPKSNPWFRFDGSNLLVSLDPSTASKAEQVRQYAVVDLDDVDLRFWITVLAARGAEGFDVSDAGARWLEFPRAEYYLPEHGAFKIDKFLGAIFIFGSMDEAQATPALLKIAAGQGHPGREIALSLLLMQATPEAFRGLRGIELTGISSPTRTMLEEHLKRPVVIKPRARPKTSRAQFLKAFNEAVNGDWAYFFDLVAQVPDGEKDVVATLRAEDVPLVRKVRRKMIARGNQHAVEFYATFTQILTTLNWQQTDLFK